MTETSVEIAERLRYPLAVGDEAVGVKILAVPLNPPPGRLSWDRARLVKYKIEDLCCGRHRALSHMALMNRAQNGNAWLCPSCSALRRNASGRAVEAAPAAPPIAPPMQPLRLHGLSWAGFVDWHSLLVFPHRRSAEVAHG